MGKRLDDGGVFPEGTEFATADARGSAAIVGAIGMAIGALGSAVVVSNAPRIKRWWEARAVPAAQVVRRRVFRREGAADEDPSDSVILTRSTLRDFSRRVGVAVDRVQAGEAGGGAERNLVEVLLAASIIADRMRTRSDDDRDAEAHLPELSAAMGRLSTVEVIDPLNRTLSSDRSPLDDDTRAIVARVFDGGFVRDGAYVPLRSDRVADALRITRSAIPLPRRTVDPSGRPGDPFRQA
jgi:hypothetical protein